MAVFRVRSDSGRDYMAVSRRSGGGQQCVQLGTAAAEVSGSGPLVGLQEVPMAVLSTRQVHLEDLLKRKWLGLAPGFSSELQERDPRTCSSNKFPGC